MVDGRNIPVWLPGVNMLILFKHTIDIYRTAREKWDQNRSVYPGTWYKSQALHNLSFYTFTRIISSFCSNLPTFKEEMIHYREKYLLHTASGLDLGPPS